MVAAILSPFPDPALTEEQVSPTVSRKLHSGSSELPYKQSGHLKIITL